MGLVGRTKEVNTGYFNTGIRLYTDGSGYEGAIGALAILYVDGRLVAKARFRLGTEAEHTVFEGELVGILLGLHMVTKLAGKRNHVSISIDNQATMQALLNNHSQPAQYLLDEIKRAMGKLHDDEKNRRRAREWREEGDEEDLQICLSWVPAHSGATGNEAADEMAKKASTNGSSKKHKLHQADTRSLHSTM